MNEKLTAYVLDELPPDERAAFEAHMQQDPALRQQAAEMREFCEMVRQEVTASQEDTLESGQRTRLIAQFQTNRNNVIRPLWRRPAFINGLGLAAAACLAVMLGIQSTRHDMERERQVFAVKPTPATKQETDSFQVATKKEERAPGAEAKALRHSVTSGNHPIPGAVVPALPPMELPKPAAAAAGGQAAGGMPASSAPKPAEALAKKAVADHAPSTAGAELKPTQPQPVPAPAPAAPTPLPVDKKTPSVVATRRAAPASAAAPAEKAKTMTAASPLALADAPTSVASSAAKDIASPTKTMKFGNISISSKQDAVIDEAKHSAVFKEGVKFVHPLFQISADMAEIEATDFGGDKPTIRKATLRGDKVRIEVSSTDGQPAQSATAGEVTFDGESGQIFLRKDPAIVRGRNNIHGTDKNTYMIISKDGTLKIHGPATTEVRPEPK